MVTYVESVRMALTAIWGNKMRAALTTLGIVIGILAVTLMGTLISGLDRSFEKSMSFLGRDVLYISKHEWFGDSEWWEIRNRPDLKVDYVSPIAKAQKTTQLFTFTRLMETIGPLAQVKPEILDNLN